eukprot:TRINITY_DN1206_c0_g1_i4.p1 TRINITY_DN1206_c0_g1~~TRINITY_DN1206_c0_g1_i4.p1  ORF type:complete len:451 (-),score=106.43 TRINITY_DN1206_c0_g1_i4:96-1448(-)
MSEQNTTLGDKTETSLQKEIEEKEKKLEKPGKCKDGDEATKKPRRKRNRDEIKEGEDFVSLVYRKQKKKSPTTIYSRARDEIKEGEEKPKETKKTKDLPVSPVLNLFMDSPDIPPWIYGDYTGLWGLHDEIEDFCHYMSPTPAEIFMRQQLFKKTEQMAHDLWPEARLQLFGSFNTNLFHPLSDIDCVIEGTFEVPAALYTMANKLYQNGIKQSDIIVLSRATVPLVKFTDPMTKCKVDISFGHMNGPENSTIIQKFCSTFSEFRPLVMVLKYFLHQNNLNQPFVGGLGSYAISLMVVSFLQQTIPRMVGKPNLGILLLDFLKFYGEEFNFFTTGISVRDGGHYFPKHDRGWLDINEMFLLALEDPNDPENDVGKSTFMIEAIQRQFVAFHRLLSNNSTRSLAPTSLSRCLFVDPSIPHIRSELAKLFPNHVSEKKPRTTPRMCSAKVDK